jgi:hypothetical protein
LFGANVQVPLVPRAIQISVIGRMQLQSEVRSDLKKILGSLQGRTDWLTSRQRMLAFLSGGTAILSWLLLIVYGILYAALWKGDVLRHWGFRVSYMTITVVMFALAIIGDVWYQSSKGREVMNISFYVLAGVSLACAMKTGDLYKKGLELRKAAGAGAPPPAV